MKKLLLLLLAAMALLSVAPAARAYDKNSWHDVDKILHQLYLRMDGVNAKRDRFGASPRMHDQIAELKLGIDDLTARVQTHGGDPTIARKRADNLSDLMSQVEAEYRDRARHAGVVINVYPG
jgi:hypothetical protein